MSTADTENGKNATNIDLEAAKIEQLQQHLAYASMGSENYHKHWLPGIVYTDGVHGLAEIAGAHWLIDAIASHQTRRAIRGNAMLRQFQVWKLKVDLEKKSAVLTCRADSGMDVSVRQRIQFTDFCLPEITLWVEAGSYMGDFGRVIRSLVVMLPQER